MLISKAFNTNSLVSYRDSRAASLNNTFSIILPLLRRYLTSNGKRYRYSDALINLRFSFSVLIVLRLVYRDINIEAL